MKNVISNIIMLILLLNQLHGKLYEKSQGASELFNDTSC